MVPPGRPSRTWSVSAGTLAAATVALAVLGAWVLLTAGQGPGDRPSAGRPPIAAATPASAVPDTRTDFTTIGDACELPTPASLQRLTPGGDNKAWHTGGDSWTCFRMGRESTRGTEGQVPFHQFQSILIEFSITSGTPPYDATTLAREALAKRRDRDRAAWGGRYKVLQRVGDDAYSGYAVIGGAGEGHATVRLRNVVFTVTYTGTAWRGLEPKEPMPGATARAGAVMLAREVAQALARCGQCRYVRGTPDAAWPAGGEPGGS